MLGILKDEDAVYLEFNPFRPKWRIKIPCNCLKFGEYGISLRGRQFTLHWYNTGYPNMMWAIRDFRKFMKRTINGVQKKDT